MNLNIVIIFLLSVLPFVGYTQGARGTESISASNVSIIKFAASGKVWESTPGYGCAVYNPAAGTLTAFDPSNTPMKSDTITAIELYSIDSIPFSFMATTKGVYYFHSNTWDSLTQLPNGYVTGIIKSPDGNLYVSTNAGVSVYNADTLDHIEDFNTGNSALPSANITGLQFEEVNANGFYASTPDSGYFYTGDAINYREFNTANSGLIDNRINFILVKADTTQHFIGTKGGLSVYSSGAFTNYTTVQGLPENDVTVIAIDCKGDMWVGTRDSGIGIYDGSTFTYLKKANGLPSDRIATINCNTSCQCWVGTYDSGLVVFDSLRNVQQLNLGISNGPQYDNGVKIFPQPANDVVNFNFEQTMDQATITICDLAGKTVIVQAVNDQSTFSMDVSKLSSGLYLYTLKNKGADIETGKISIIK